MARKQPPRMLPPSQTPGQPGEDDPTYDANAAIVLGLLEEHGEFIHWWNGEGEASRCRDPEAGPEEDPDDGTPLSVVLPHGARSGLTVELAPSLMPWAGSRDGNCLGVYRLEFERLLSTTRPDMLDGVRAQLDEAYRRQDGPAVVAILPEHIIVATCIDRTQAN